MNVDGFVYIHSSPTWMDNIVVDDNNTPGYHPIDFCSSNHIGKRERYAVFIVHFPYRNTLLQK